MIVKGWVAAVPTRLRWGSLAGLALVAMFMGVTAPGFHADPLRGLDPGAWLWRGRDLVHASAVTAVADWILPDAVGATEVTSAQDGARAVVVDRTAGRAFAIDPVNLEPSGSAAVDPGTVPFVRGDDVYLVSDGVVRWLDPVTLTQKAAVAVPGRAVATIDGGGDLWVLTPRDGRMRRLHDGAVAGESPLARPGNRLDLTLAGNRPVAVDHDARLVAFVDRTSARAEREVSVAATGTVQGGALDGDRVWMAEGAALTGVRDDGDALRVEVGHAPLHRPEVVGGQVYAFAGDGTVTAVDARTGERARTEPLPAAREADFDTFVKDGHLWFTAPTTRSSGNVQGDGRVVLVQEDRAQLAAAARVAPRPDEPAPPTTAPPGRPAPTAPRPAPRTAPTTPPTTVPPVTVPPTSAGPGPIVLPPFAGADPAAYCNQLVAQGVKSCKPVANGEFGPARAVTSVSPAVGTPVSVDTPVQVAHTEQGVEVPNISAADRDRDGACRTLQARGLQCGGDVGRASGVPVKPGAVWGQSLPAGTWVGAGTQVGVTYDTVEWRPLTQCHKPGTKEMFIKVGAERCDPGFTPSSLGVAAATPAPGTVPLYRHHVNGKGSNVSDFAWPAEENVAGSLYYQAGEVIGHVYPMDVDAGTRTVYHWVWHSDRYYSVNPDDPVGATYLRNPATGQPEPHEVAWRVDLWRTW